MKHAPAGTRTFVNQRMSILSRTFHRRFRAGALRTTLALSLGGLPALAAAAPAEAAPSPPATVKSFYSVLLRAMKGGTKLGFAGRRQLLAPEIRHDFDLPLMTRLVVGLLWREMAPAEQQELISAFSDFSIANYANQFSDFSGERFVVDPTGTSVPGGDVIVHTKLFTGGGKTVQLDYRMRRNGGSWQILDVYLTGTISQLAARRSEFASVLRRGGAAALVKLLKEKTAALAR